MQFKIVSDLLGESIQTLNFKIDPLAENGITAQQSTSFVVPSSNTVEELKVSDIDISPVGQLTITFSKKIMKSVFLKSSQQDDATN